MNVYVIKIERDIPGISLGCSVSSAVIHRYREFHAFLEHPYEYLL